MSGAGLTPALRHGRAGSTWRGAAALGLAVLAGSAAVYAGGAAYIAVGVLGVLGALVVLPRPALLVGALAAAGFAAVSIAGIVGSSVSLADAAVPVRNALTVALPVVAVVLAYRAGAPALRVLLPVAPLLLVIGASVALAPVRPEDALIAAPFVALLAGGALIGWYLTAGEERLRAFVDALAWGCGAVVVGNVVLLPLVGQPAFLGAAEGPRFQGILENPNSVGVLGFAALPALICAGLMRPAGSRARAAAFAVAALALAQVLLSVSRAGLGGAFVALGVLVLGTTARRPVLRVGLAVAMAAVVALLAATGGSSAFSQGLRLDTVAEGSGRAQVAELAIDSVRAQPLLGYGYGSEPTIVRSYGQVGSFTGEYAGNIFIDVALELGLLGLLALAFAVGSIAWRIRFAPHSRLSRTHRLALLAALATAAGGLADAQGESVLMRPGGPGAAVFWICVGVCSAEAWRRYVAAHRRTVLAPAAGRWHAAAAVAASPVEPRAADPMDPPPTQPVAGDPSGIDVRLRELLRCPVCRGALGDTPGAMRCADCGARYEVSDGIPRLVAGRQAGEGYDFYNAEDAARYGRGELDPQFADPIREFLAATPRSAVVVELGSGQGAFYGAHPGLVGLDLSWFALREYGSGPRIQATGEALPFADASVDALFTVATLEHIPHPARALAEIDRVLRPGGRALLYPAWYVRPWAAKGLAHRSYADLPPADRIRKATIAIRDRRPYQFLRVLPGRLAREAELAAGRRVGFRYWSLEPNLDVFVTSDSDAFSSMDPHAAAAFFISRGYRDLRRGSPRGRLLYGYEPVVVQKGGA